MYNQKLIMKKNFFSISLTGVDLKSEKEFYISECEKLYRIFKIKLNAILIGNLLFNFFMICQIKKVIKINGKKEKLEKDDAIVYDEEQNVRF